jgi:hypothetical protein
MHFLKAVLLYTAIFIQILLLIYLYYLSLIKTEPYIFILLSITANYIIATAKYKARPSMQ